MSKMPLNEITNVGKSKRKLTKKYEIEKGYVTESDEMYALDVEDISSDGFLVKNIDDEIERYKNIK